MFSQRALLAYLVAMLTLAAPTALAATKTYMLPEGVTAFRPGPGKDITENNCLVCHSSDYISTQPPGLGKKFWEEEVTKMRKAFGAQISEEDAAAIADYLARSY